jgi:hypothetical protein
MIEFLEGFPDGTVAFAAKGHVTKEDYEKTVIPRLKDAFARHGKIRCYYELGGSFSGIDSAAAWEDFKLGVGHLSRWERVAVVTDVEWIRFAMNAFRFLVPADIRLFGTGEVAAAKSWIAAP